ncbi:GPCR family 2-like protein [Macrophomina phaseolina MS6]|uniref:GPCR family 2-like protein n=1 Tax=Macrophomina phaseolina (strain MS6) TaxID=1126212 RepID=K2QH98_MACPH|nr:GPCR family 2-like protein [Macrophomina phaseolina MS6]
MAGNRLEKELCPEPLLDASQAGRGGGYLSGRVCVPVVDSISSLSCCLPCPATDWIYSDSFRKQYKAAECLCVVGSLLCLFLLLSWLFLPKKDSKRDHLNVCLVTGILSLALGFVLPLTTRPDECFDAITPNDMSASLSCAWSGMLIVFGGLTVATWVFLRSLSLHLLVCWNIHVGRRFFVATQGIGWSVVIVLSGVTLGVTGVSIRFGDACHVNTNGSVPSFWGPLLVMSGLSAVLQLATFAFGLNLYILQRARLSAEKYEESTSTRLRQIWNLVRLQWRAIAAVVLILIDVIFFCSVFLRIGSNEKQAHHHVEEVYTWLTCLTSHPTDRSVCLVRAQNLFIDQDTVAALLFLLAASGIQCFLVFVQQPLVYGWLKLARRVLGCERRSASHAELGDSLGTTEVFSAAYGVVARPKTVEVRKYDKRSKVVNAEHGKAGQAINEEARGGASSGR